MSDLLLDLDLQPPPPTEIQQLPLGIHFGVPDEFYFAQSALGSTDRKQLAIDPVEWQFARLHGEETETKAKIWGSALHARVLEGQSTFLKRFGVLPNKAAIEGLLVTVEDLTNWLKTEGAEFKSSARKADLVKLVRSIDPTAPIWDDIVAEFERDYPEGNRLTAEMADGVEIASRWMQGTAKLAPFMSNGAFAGGAPEVTVIYEIKGVRLKARLDYLLPGVIIDLKSYRPWRNGDATATITQAIGNFRYDLQAAAYIEAFEHAAAHFKAGRIFGALPYAGYLDQVFATGEMPRWVWVMVKGDGAPQPRIVELPQETTVFKVAQTQIDIALQSYLDHVERFGADQDWQPEQDVIVLADEDFPSWFGRY